MGKKTVDLGNAVEEINAQAALIAEVARERSPKAEEVLPERRTNRPSIGDQDGRAEQRNGSNLVSLRGSHQTTQVAQFDDPWLSRSVKMRNSKQKRLKELSLQRQLAGLEPHQQKDLVDEALDYIFEKYGVS